MRAAISDDLEKLRATLGDLPEPIVRPYFIVVSGLPGTGKTFLCRKLREKLPAVVLESDALRKTLFPRPSYSAEESAYLFTLIHRLSEELLKKGIPVILDATNLSERNREFLYAIAERNDAKLILVRVEAPPEVVRQRLEARVADPENKSDADWKVYRRMRASMDRIQRNHFAVDTSRDITPVIEKICREAKRR